MPTSREPMATPRYLPASAAPVPPTVDDTCVPCPLVVSVSDRPSRTSGPVPNRSGASFTFCATLVAKRRVDAGVDHCDGDALAGIAQFVPDAVGTDQGNALIEKVGESAIDID